MVKGEDTPHHPMSKNWKLRLKGAQISSSHSSSEQVTKPYWVPVTSP